MILEGGSIVVQQIIILFLMIGLGVVAAHFGLLKEEGTRQLTELLLIIITPCVIIMAFQLSFERSLIKNILIAAFLGALTPTIAYLYQNYFFEIPRWNATSCSDMQQSFTTLVSSHSHSSELFLATLGHFTDQFSLAL